MDEMNEKEYNKGYNPRHSFGELRINTDLARDKTNLNSLAISCSTVYLLLIYLCLIF